MKLLFVCLGNICRSPLAEALFNKHIMELAPDSGILAESAGTSAMHVGENPDPRTIKNALKHNLEINHKGRQFTFQDFQKYDLIITMDHSNFTNVTKLAETTADLNKVVKMRVYDGEQSGKDVPDPWFGGEQGFEDVYSLLNQCTKNLAVNCISTLNH